MNKAIVCVGVSASGKSTFAKELCEKDSSFVEINRDWVRFNVIAPGANWNTYKFRKQQEQEVTEICQQMIIRAYFDEQNVIVSDTNLNQKRRDELIKFLEDYDFEVEIKEFPISLEEAWSRDRIRENGVGHEVIYRQYQQWIDYKGRKRYTPNTNQPKAIIVDVDGTIADMQGIRKPYEWNRVGEDKPRQLILDVVKGLHEQEYAILVVSGRDMVCWDETKDWLAKHDVPHYYLFMRKEGDMRKDTIVKEEIFWNYIAENWNVVAVLDDRPSVVRLWMELGIENVLNVGNPWQEF